MPSNARIRRTFSISNELLRKSREAALAAVQIFNSPLVTFKSEIYIVLMNIAWTYLMHAYYRKHKIEYRYFRQTEQRRAFDRTKGGAYKYWELERCLNDGQSPIDKDTANNLRFLIGIRHEIEHQMTTKIDANLSAKFQACCLNYNEYIKKLFSDDLSIDRYLSFSLQFSSISRKQSESLPDESRMPSYIKSFIEGFEGSLSEEEYNSPKFAYRVLFIAKTANKKGQADQVIEFVAPDSDLAANVNKTYAVIKETERPKYLPSRVVNRMKELGYSKFSMHDHTMLWKAEKARDPSKGYGVHVGDAWYWYERWVDYVSEHCGKNEGKYHG